MTSPTAPASDDSSPSYGDYLAADGVGAPRFLQEQSWRSLGDGPIAAERYTSREFFELEAARLWPRVWQMVCREEDIPAVGDALPYDIVGKSFIVLRTAPDTVRAYYNSCPHRGRKLLLAPGHLDRIHCPFHGFTWNLTGDLRSAPCRWDFKHLSDSELALPQARVERWGGFVFLNMDPNAAPLSEYLGVLPSHFERWAPEARVKSVHVGKVIQCNWKIAQEAFMESYHVVATHPQILSFCADANARYDLLSENVNRNLTAFAAPSPHVARQTSPEQTRDGMLAMLGRGAAKVGDGEPRPVVGGLVRESFRRAYGGDWTGVSDAELLDAIVYNVFPNFSPWGGFAPSIVYRWRPNGRDVASCLMEVMILKPLKAGEPQPSAAPFRLLGENEAWSDVAELPILGAVIDQDMGNMPYVQRGLEASGTGQVQLASYQESRIRHFHTRIDAYIRQAEPAGAAVWPL